MRTFSLFAVVILIAASAAALTIGGTVSQSSGAPLSGMIVAAYQPEGILAVPPASTDFAGRYTLTVPAGSYRLLAYDPTGFYATSFYDRAESFETSLTLHVQTNLTGINFALPRAGFIVGTIVAPGGSPIANAVVAAYNLSGTRRGFTHTDAAGRYTLALPDGVYKLVAYDDAGIYAPTFSVDQPAFSNAAPIAVTAPNASIVNFILPFAAHIGGSATDAMTRAPLPGIVVTAFDASQSAVATAVTDATGQYRLALRPGAYRLVFEDRSGVYAPVFYPNAGSFETATAVAAVLAATTTANATMVVGGRLEGHVVDAVSRAATAGITVAAFNPDGTTRAFTVTDSTGRYSLVVPEGLYKVGVYDNALHYAPQFFAGVVAVHTATITAPVDFAIEPAGRFSGTVTEQIGGAPIAGVAVAAFDLAGNQVAATQTATNGVYHLAVRPGTYKLVAFDRALRYASAYLDPATNFEASRTVTVAAENEITGLDFVMSAGTSVTGSVVDITSGSAVPGILVVAYNASGERIAEAVTGALGTFGFALPAGVYRFVASDPLRRYATSYYRNAADFASALALSVNPAQSGIELSFRLTAAPRSSRRRAVSH